MNREKMNRHKKNKKELALLEKQIEKLYERLESVPVVMGKVSASSSEFPYVKTHVKVQVEEPKAASKIKEQINKKEIRARDLKGEIEEVEEFIEGLPEGIEKQIFEMIYLEGESQGDAAEAVGYTQSMISRIIKGVLKDS